MREIYLSGYSNFVIPFMIGMVFVLSWCVIGAIRIIFQLTREDRKTFFMSLINPKIMMKNIRDWFCDCIPRKEYISCGTLYFSGTSSRSLTAQ